VCSDKSKEPCSDHAVVNLGAHEGSTFLIMESNASTSRAGEEAIRALENPDEGKNRECQRTPMDESRGSLMSKDSPKRPSNGNGSGEIALGGGKGVGSCGALKEEPVMKYEHEGKQGIRKVNSQSEEDKDFGPDTGSVGEGIDTECLEAGQDDEDSGPTMVQREWKVDEELVTKALRRVELFDNIVDVLGTVMIRRRARERWEEG
jgi:hypothetical protein